MKAPAAERLWKAIERLRISIEDHCQKVINSPLKLGACTVNPKRAGVSLPSPVIQLEIENQARKYFEFSDVIGLYFRYWTPPMLPIIDKPGAVSTDDYQITCEIPQFDESWAQTSLARGWVFCPTESEFPCIEEWFVPQIEAIRFTPILYQNLQELQQLSQIRMSLFQSALLFFEGFVGNHIFTDPNLELSQKERKEYRQQPNDWQKLYPEVISIFKNQHFRGRECDGAG